MLATVLVLLACLGASSYYWFNMRSSVRDTFSKEAEQAIKTTEQSIGGRLQVYSNIMVGGSGLFMASDSVTRQEWEDFITAFNVQEQYPGVQGFGYGEHVMPASLDSHVQAVRATDIPEYSVIPKTNSEPYAPVLYISPFSSQRRPILGFDMMSEPARRKALLRARDTGQMSVTGKVTLAQTKDGGATNKEPGLIIYLPVYTKNMPIETTEQRQQAIQGYIYAALRLNELLKGIFGDEGNSQLGLQVYNGQDKNEDELMYRSENFQKIANARGSLVNERVLDIGDEKLLMSYVVSPQVLSSTDRNAPWSTLLRGIVISITVALLVYYLLTNRTRKMMRAQHAEVQSAKDDLLSLASHQLRTPATVVKQYVGMLLQGYGGAITKQQESMLNSAYVSNERQLQIINQILYVARLDAGQLKLQKEKFDIAQLVRDIVKEHEPSIKSSKQKIIKKIPRGPVIISGDPQYLYMAVDNLISNANKYTPAKGKITLTLERTVKEVTLSVADTGVGISEIEAKHIFDKFTRGESEMTAVVSGSGIGLYLVKRIAELHRGAITVAPNRPKGTVFKLCIPARHGVKSTK